MFESKVYSLDIAAASANNATVRLRCEVVSLRLQGWVTADICEELSCSERFVRKWHSVFISSGLEDLLLWQGPGRPPMISLDILKKLEPSLLKSQILPRPARGNDFLDILSDSGIIVKLSTAYNTLHKCNLSYKTTRPVHPERSQEAVDAWQIEFPKMVAAIAETFKNKKIRIFFQDETRYGMKGIDSRQWSPVGSRPIRVRQVDYENAWIFGAVEPRTGAHHAMVTSHVGTDFMQCFMDSLQSEIAEDEHVILVMDNASWHKTAKLNVNSNVTLHFLPPYSPDLNPVERLWQFIKSNYLCNKVYGAMSEIITAGVDAWQKLTKEICKSVCSRDYCKT